MPRTPATDLPHDPDTQYAIRPLGGPCFPLSYTDAARQWKAGLMVYTKTADHDWEPYTPPHPTPRRHT